MRFVACAEIYGEPHARAGNGLVDVVREWADVFVPALDERLTLEGKALFFIPSALEHCSQAHLNRAYLGSLSNTAEIGPVRAGRAAISKVLRFEPVTYASARGFLNVANYGLKSRDAPLMNVSDIVACVFRLKEPDTIAAALNLSPQMIAAGTLLPQELIVAALGRFRLQFVDAFAIWRFLLNFQLSGPASGGGLEFLTDNPADFIKTDGRYPLAIKEVGDREFVYGLRNLEPAAAKGHYWAIEDS